MTRDLLDEIKAKWNIHGTLPMRPWGKDDVVWLVQEIERLRAAIAKASGDLETAHSKYSPYGQSTSTDTARATE